MPSFALALLVAVGTHSRSRAAEIAIVTGPGASSAERIAAQELAAILKKIYPGDRFASVATLPANDTVILVGRDWSTIHVNDVRRLLCRVLNVFRSGYYRSRRNTCSVRKRRDATLAAQIAATHRKGRGNFRGAAHRPGVARTGHAHVSTPLRPLDA